MLHSLPGKKKLLTSVALAVVFIGMILVLLLPAITAQFGMYVEKVDQIPDIKQTDQRFGFPDKGRDFCAPVVVADAFVYLNKNGYQRILDDADNPEDVPVRTCCKLAELMHTRTGPGTTTEDFLSGLQQYIAQHTPYSIKSLSYSGWNRHPKEFDIGRPIPDLKWIKDGIQDNRSEWLNIGWYSRDPQTGVLKRLTGHWVIMAGYGIGADGISNANTLIARDPDPGHADASRKIFITVAPMTDGQLTGPHAGLPRSAIGYLQIKSLGNSGNVDHKDHTGIIDGAIILELAPSWMVRN